ncbi:hypothetical protein CNBG_1410 [Cryptococcus deuterogattii R265]|uniref:Uncharacterized protein n=1 Tax=Cryptococcus deuterogattii (strain R265) TaxID=294750 RepID=A0A095C4T9_CRYD2|nr:hypothetical protein CNBG_1410 [Cryptococcus deuterogattii R265]KIR72904.1 hypothetical protein I310_03508 [Cryptococcus deuterogattii CA1014]
MKISIALIAALAASANASPIRLIVASEPDAKSFDVGINSPETEFPRLSAEKSPLDQLRAGTVVEKKPCHGALSTFWSYMGWNGMSSSTTSTLGRHKGKERFMKDKPGHKHRHKHHAKLIDEQQRHGLLDSLRSYFPGYTPYLLGGAAASSSTPSEHHIPSEHYIPYMTSEELNTIFYIDRTPEIKWWRPATGLRGKWEVKEGMGEWRAAKKGERPPSREHKGHKREKFFHRLRRSLDNLTFLESLAIALVIGIGLGSIAHLIMMLFILSCRRLGLAIFSGARFGFGFRFPQCSREQMRTGEEAERKGEKETQKAIIESDDRQMIEKKEEEQSRGQAEIKLSERDEVVSEGTRFEDECLPEYEEGEDAPFFKEKDLGV